MRNCINALPKCRMSHDKMRRGLQDAGVYARMKSGSRSAALGANPGSFVCQFSQRRLGIGSNLMFVMVCPCSFAGESEMTPKDRNTNDPVGNLNKLIDRLTSKSVFDGPELSRSESIQSPIAKATLSAVQSGVTLKEYEDRIENMFHNSWIHTERMRMFEQIARAKNIDASSEEGRAEVWRAIARITNIDRKLTHQIIRGEADMKLDLLWLALSHYGLERSKIMASAFPSYDNTEEAIRFAIARCLTYIQILPPRDLDDAPPVSQELRHCWRFVWTQPYYKLRKDLNQNGMDNVVNEFNKYKTIVMTADRLGDLKYGMETNDARVSNWTTAWTIFKYVAITDKKRYNKMSASALRFIFDTRTVRYAAIWKQET
jgi:hypothetical protein